MREAASQFHFRLIAALFLVLLWAACLDQASGPAAPDVLDGPTAGGDTTGDREGAAERAKAPESVHERAPGLARGGRQRGRARRRWASHRRCSREARRRTSASGHARDRHRQVQRARLAIGAAGEAAGEAHMRQGEPGSL